MSDEFTVSRPHYGWCTVVFGGFVIKGVSYLTNVPFEMEAFFTKQSTKMELDCEGSIYEIKRTNDNWNYVVTKDDELVKTGQIKDPKAAANEYAREFEFWFEDWVGWACPMTQKEFETEVEYLTESIEALKNI